MTTIRITHNKASGTFIENQSTGDFYLMYKPENLPRKAQSFICPRCEGEGTEDGEQCNKCYGDGEIYQFSEEIAKKPDAFGKILKNGNLCNQSEVKKELWEFLHRSWPLHYRFDCLPHKSYEDLMNYFELQKH